MSVYDKSCKKRLQNVRPSSTSFSLFCLFSGLVSEHEQMCGPELRMCYRMSVIYGHPVMAATRALCFSDHVTKGNGGSGDKNGVQVYWHVHTAHAYTSVTLSRERETRQPLVDNEILTRSRPPENDFRKVRILCFKLMLVFS